VEKAFSGQLALVTGGSRGIGRAIALKFGSLGADVIVNYSRSQADADEVVGELQALGVNGWTMRADLGEVGEIVGLFQQVREQFGGLDFLVNSAARGLQRPRDAISSLPNHLKRTFDVNVLGPWFCAREAAPLMEARGGGAIVNLSSLGSRRYMPRYAAVGVTKGALDSLNTYLAVELAPKGIRVNAVCPSWVEETGGVMPLPEDMGALIARSTPAGRHVTPEDVADLVVTLCRPELSMVVGQNIVIDGGVSLLGMLK
jgi:enoyl-[acyl-carrier protein] reductase III